MQSIVPPTGSHECGLQGTTQLITNPDLWKSISFISFYVDRHTVVVLRPPQCPTYWTVGNIPRREHRWTDRRTEMKTQRGGGRWLAPAHYSQMCTNKLKSFAANWQHWRHAHTLQCSQVSPSRDQVPSFIVHKAVHVYVHIHSTRVYARVQHNAWNFCGAATGRRHIDWGVVRGELCE